ncbi:Nematode Specific Peptide family [Caenorhabditis elegans]|uniref:Nematode Specific Peptide family n=1 Tax=Caenorhabditis elegans TaxID=6239 RepID=C8JQP5_CAEEL|nr:Nematode Specific Peptide family [Caenorhabditis elegans]CCD73950.2 Nematode Specific Peptide family [Caenorhabditis elegans]|eukprot:NP_001254951.2 Uncharacterized protein CELE_T04A6.4 [Caenorhabditis elegans]
MYGRAEYVTGSLMQKWKANPWTFLEHRRSCRVLVPIQELAPISMLPCGTCRVNLPWVVIYIEGGKVAANFSWFNNDYCKSVGSIQLLVRLGPQVVGHEYGWIPFPEPANFDAGKIWKPVHVNNHKGDISFGVVNLPCEKQIFAKVDVRNESYGYGNQGKEHSARGPACASSVSILCRKALPGYQLEG